MKNKIAIDIVLLPPQNINDLAFRLNQGTDQSKIKFGTDSGDAIPHITLAMGAISFSDITKMESELETIYKKYLPLTLKLNGTSGGEIENQGYVWGIEIEKTDELLLLHKEVIEILEKYSSKDFDTDSFADQGNGIERAFKWMSNFAEHSAYDKFSPHITIGFGDEPKIENEEFTVFTLAICQLGSFCTCKKILKEFSGINI